MPGLLIYRRARPVDFNDEPLESGIRSVGPKLFIPKPEDGLSVFDASLTTPYDVLYHHIENCRRMAATDDEKQKKQWIKRLERDASVAHMLEIGWRIVSLPLSAFPANTFTYTEPSQDPFDKGHFEIIGTQRDFELQSLNVRPMCIVLEPDVCTKPDTEPEKQ